MREVCQDKISRLVHGLALGFRTGMVCASPVAAKQPIGPSGRKIEWGPSPPLLSLSFHFSYPLSLPSLLFFTPSISPIALLPNSLSLSLTLLFHYLLLLRSLSPFPFPSTFSVLSSGAQGAKPPETFFMFQMLLGEF
jgi:hypothetical protein